MLFATNEGSSVARLILPVMPTSLSTMGNLVRDTALREEVAKNRDVWNASIAVIVSYYEHDIFVS